MDELMSLGHLSNVLGLLTFRKKKIKYFVLSQINMQRQVQFFLLDLDSFLCLANKYK